MLDRFVYSWRHSMDSTVSHSIHFANELAVKISHALWRKKIEKLCSIRNYLRNYSVFVSGRKFGWKYGIYQSLREIHRCAPLNCGFAKEVPHYVYKYTVSYKKIMTILIENFQTKSQHSTQLSLFFFSQLRCWLDDVKIFVKFHLNSHMCASVSACILIVTDQNQAQPMHNSRNLHFENETHVQRHRTKRMSKKKKNNNQHQIGNLFRLKIQAQDNHHF